MNTKSVFAFGAVVILFFSGSQSLANIKNNDLAQAVPSREQSISEKLSAEFLKSAAPSDIESVGLYRSHVWMPDNGNGTYTNPVLYADYSDPDVVCVEDNFYMTSSSFSSIPGLPILRSKDLVNWTLIGHALKTYPDELFATPQHGKGVWAPSIRYHNGMFYIYWGDPDAGIYMVRSKHAEGPWEKPVLVLAGLGLIDPCPLWDEDGKAYLVHAWAASRAGIKSILTVRTMNAEGTEVSAEGKHVFDGHGSHPTIEGPKFYKHNGYYYILAPAGGVRQGWQLALRSKNIYGPYETKIVLEQGQTSTNGPHQGGWVQTPSGQSWFLHFQDHQSYGRIVHLQPIQWKNDWPLMGTYNKTTNKCEPVSTYTKPQVSGHCPIVNPAESDEFDSDRLGLQWQWQANPRLTWYAMLNEGKFLRLFAQTLPSPQANLWDAGNVLLQKFPAPDFTVTTKMTFVPEEDGKRAGLVIMGKDYAALSMCKTENGYVLSQVVCKGASNGACEEVLDEVTFPDNTVFMRVTVSSPEGLCQFSVSSDGKTFTTLGQPFQSKAGAWIGAKVGLFCVGEVDMRNGGYADFDWFRFE